MNLDPEHEQGCGILMSLKNSGEGCHDEGLLPRVWRRVVRAEANTTIGCAIPDHCQDKPRAVFVPVLSSRGSSTKRLVSTVHS